MSLPPVVNDGLLFTTTKVFGELMEAWDSGYRRFLAEGGTSSSKTYTILQFLIYLAQESEEELLISIVSESLPHLKRGAMRDFFRILGEDPKNNPYFNVTDNIYRRSEWKGWFEFFGSDDASKSRGPRRHILFINEGNNVFWDTARGLDIRTEKFTIVDWNPVGTFWAHDYWKEEKTTFNSHSTYLDALHVLPQDIVDNIESNKDKDPNWWNIYGLGLVGKVTGLVHPFFTQIKTLPEGTPFYGLDYGFLVDPTVLVKNIIIGDKLYSQQMFYEYGPMTNDQIARQMVMCGVKHDLDEIFGDPDEPKSTAEIAAMRFNIQDAVKGPGSVKFGQQRVNQFYQHWTEDSIDCIKEQRNFRFIMKKEPSTGREYLSDDTTHRWSHGMAGRRYAVATYIPNDYGYRSKAVDYQ